MTDNPWGVQNEIRLFWIHVLMGLSMIMGNNLYAQSLSHKDVAALIDKARHKYNIPAMAVVVMDADHLLISEIQGKRNVNANDDAKIDDFFHIGSCAKTILAFMAGKLIEDGRIAWETKFFDIFPALIDSAKQDYLDITLEDLLLCQAGIQPFTTGEDFAQLDADVASSRPAFINYLIKQKPAGEKTKEGFGYFYSNASYTLAAAMVEQAAGLSCEQLIEKTLTQDLGLSVIVGWPNNHSKDQPWGHWESEGIIEPFAPDNAYRLPNIVAPAGDLSMRPLDYAKFVQRHLQGLRGMDNYLSAATYQTIHYRHPGFSLGVANQTSWGERFSIFAGSAGIFLCTTLIFPGGNLAFVVLTNSGSQKAEKAVEWVSNKIIKKHYHLWWMIWM